MELRQELPVAKKPSLPPVAIREPQAVLAALPKSHVILRGEEEEQYARILNQIAGGISPTDIIEEFWVRDIADLLWDALRLRRLKGNLLQAGLREGLIKVLRPLAGISEAEDLADGYFKGEPQAKEEVDALLAEAGLSFDVVQAEALAARLNDIERFDRMIASAESRRNAILRDMSRRRDAFAARLARVSEAIEEAEFAEVDLGEDQKAAPDDQQP